MKHQEGFFTGVQGSKLFYQCWLPDGCPKARLLLVHGLAEHSGRYGTLASHFVPRGFALYAVDHVGHGQSEGQRLYVANFAEYTDSLKIFLDHVRDSRSEAPLFLIGHSMGGLIVALYLKAHQKGLAGAVLSGPAVRLRHVSAAVVAVGRLISLIFPRLGLVALEADGISRDPSVLAAYLADPLVAKTRITARLGAEMLDAMERLQASAGRITVPLLILQGGADRLVDPAGAQLLYDQAASCDKTLIVYEGLYHEVLNEPERARVLSDLDQWLEARLGAQPGPAS
jgi:alpha-beta hydrolase superfamily lysophospholipase